MRGSFLKNTPLVTCLVLNVGIQCIGSVFKDPRKVNESQTDAKLQSYVETQRSFDKAYKQSIRLFHIGYMIMFLVISLLSIYLSSNTNFSNLLHFEHMIIESKMGMENGKAQSSWEFSKYFFDKQIGVFLVLMSSLPFSFSNIIQLLILYSTSFAEWDIDVIPANILFRSPNATLAFGKVAHMFFGRSAIQRYDKQCIKLFYIGGHFFNNQQSQKYWEKQKNNQIQKLNLSYDESDQQTNSNNSLED